jgi:penicillin amidase
MKLITQIFLLLLVFSQSAQAEQAQSEDVTIYRDAHGTPHVVAGSNRGVFYGYGYAVASDRLFQMEMLKRTTQGRVAEVLGEGFLDLDKHIRTSYDHRAVRRQLDFLAPERGEILQAYADGFNARLSEVAAQPKKMLPGEFSHYEFTPEKWTAYDVAMLFVGSIAHRYSDFNSERDNLSLLMHLEGRHGKDNAWRIFNASKWLLDAGSPTTVPGPGKISRSLPPRPAYLDRMSPPAAQARVALYEDGLFAGLTNDPAVAEMHRQQLASAGFAQHPEYAGASNYWAVRQLSDASAALLNGPQFGFSAPGYVYGIGLHGGDFHAVGNTLLALPALLFAHNNHIAWGSTAGISDQSDEFLLRLDPDNPERYRHGNDWLEFDAWPERIAVRGGEAITVTARRSAQGMVMEHDPVAGIAWARGRAWEGHEVDTLMAWTFLATDRSLDEAHRRVADMATNINIYTMDRRGNLGYVHSGRYPQRAAGHDPRLPAPGDGAMDWQGMRPYGDNPTVRNPAQGYIANWNNRPAADWISSDLWSYTWGRADRARILFDELDAVRGKSVKDMDEINRRTSFADINAPFFLSYLQSAWEGRQTGPVQGQALAALEAWDGQWQPDADGYYGAPQALMEAWLRILLREAIADDVGEEMFHLYAATNYPHKALGPSIPNAPGLKALLRNLDDLREGRQPDYDFFNGADPAMVIRQSFEGALAELAGQGNELSAWRLRAHPMQWRPFNYRGVPQALDSAQQSLPGYMNRGSENNLFVATGKGIEARDVIPPGQSGFVAADGKPAAHVTDQMGIYARFEYKPVPFGEEQVRAAAVGKRVLKMPSVSLAVGGQ